MRTLALLVVLTLGGEVGKTRYCCESVRDVDGEVTGKRCRRAIRGEKCERVQVRCAGTLVDGTLTCR